MIRWLVGLALVVLLSVDGWGCAGAAMCPAEADGWTCNEDCSDCWCDDVVRPKADTIGECLPLDNDTINKPLDRVPEPRL